MVAIDESPEELGFSALLCFDLFVLNGTKEGYNGKRRECIVEEIRMVTDLFVCLKTNIRCGVDIYTK